MSTETKRTTIYFDPDILHLLRLKSEDTGRWMSELVNDAVRAVLAEDAGDISSFAHRAAESDLPLESVVEDLRRKGGL